MWEEEGWRSKGDTWWYEEEVNWAVSRKKDAHTVMCQSSSEENKRRYEGMRNIAKITVSEVMRDKVEETLTEFENCRNGMFRPVRGLRVDGKVVEGGRCMRGTDGKLCLIEDRGNLWCLNESEVGHL